VFTNTSIALLKFIYVVYSRHDYCLGQTCADADACRLIPADAKSADADAIMSASAHLWSVVGLLQIDACWWLISRVTGV